jgi:hypothetical protein
VGDPACWLDRVCADCGRVDDLDRLDGQRRCAGCAEPHRTGTRMADDVHACADCGAAACEALLHACLAADFSDPDHGSVHHLVVPAYGLQHGWYTAEAEAEILEFILSHLDRPPSDHDRRRIRAAADGSARVRARHPRSRHLDWGHHIGDVDRSSAGSYVATVRNWATSTATMLLDGPPTVGRRDA